MKDNSNTLLIFDCDGVLVNSEPLANRTFIHCLRNEGIDVDEAYGYKHFLGISTRDCINHIESTFNRKLSDTFLDTLSLLTNEEIKNSLQPIPNIKEALSQLAYPKCVASGSEPDKIRLSLDVTGLRPFFTNIYSSLQVQHGKPHPDIFLFAAREMGFSPEQCIVIEDSDPGVKAAINANMKVLLYRPELNADAVFKEKAILFDDMILLPELIEELVQEKRA